MLFPIRRVKFGRLWSFQCNPSTRGSHVNLNRSVIGNWSNYSTRVDLSLPDRAIKSYLRSITTAYRAELKGNNEFQSLIQVEEVTNLLEDRLHTEENIRTLQELSEQDAEIKKSSQDELLAYISNLTQLDEQLLEVIADNVGRDNCRDVILEITAGVGGQEAMLFTSDLLKMYEGHFQHLGFVHEYTEVDAETTGAVRHASILVSGVRAFEMLRHEGGVHRVQRIPSTERSGRMHTSTASVVVMPQPTDIEVKIEAKDLKIETKTATGPGGQSVNKTESAVRITHLPTGIIAECQTDRSQIRNKATAMLKLRARIYDMQMSEQKESTVSIRLKQRGMSQRNEKIRTYNYNQDRITDHRIPNGTLHNLRGFMEGGEGLEELQMRLQRFFQLKLLREDVNKCK